jgi:hypothetical protein
VEYFVSVDSLLRPERSRDQATQRLHIAISDFDAKTFLMRRANAAVKEVQREYLFTLGRHITEATLHVWDGIGLDEPLHDSAVVHGDDYRAD